MFKNEWDGMGWDGMGWDGIIFAGRESQSDVVIHLVRLRWDFGYDGGAGQL